jgi:hypothetical protein
MQSDLRLSAVIPAQAGIQTIQLTWIPASAGMTRQGGFSGATEQAALGFALI